MEATKVSEFSLNKNNAIDEPIQFEADDNQIYERYFPKENQTTEFDTIIPKLNLEIWIQNTTLNSYVTNTFESSGKSYIDKYRDRKTHLKIYSQNKVILDTILVKETFKDYAGQEFLDIANFHGYWFNNIENEKIEFIGTINKPETDWSFVFQHFFDLSTHEFRFEEYLDEEQ